MALEPYAALLNALPAESTVAVVTMTGSCCPVTLAHIQCFAESRQILLGEKPRPKGLEHFSEALGFLSINSDRHVSSKLQQKHLPSISYENRAMLVQLAVEDLPWMFFNRMHEHDVFSLLVRTWPKLQFVRFALNGADDVLKYRKWKSCSADKRAIAMGRAGMTEKLRTEVRRSGLDLERGWFIFGPELPDISSTAVRAAVGTGDLTALNRMLHPHVIQWCLTESPYKPKGFVPSLVCEHGALGSGTSEIPEASTWQTDMRKTVSDEFRAGRITDDHRGMLLDLIKKDTPEDQVKHVLQQMLAGDVCDITAVASAELADPTAPRSTACT